jgi:hypothetical protein
MSITIIDNTTEQVYTILTDFAGAAVRAEAAADLSQAWAEGTEPGGAGTKSAKEHSEDAEASATAAGVSETNAGVSETNAGLSEAKAEKWAEENEDVEVEVGKYSAKHHSAKAEGFKDDAETAASQAQGAVDTHAATVGNHTDVDLTGAADGDYLKRESGVWVRESELDSFKRIFGFVEWGAVALSEFTEEIKSGTGASSIRGRSLLLDTGTTAGSTVGRATQNASGWLTGISSVSVDFSRPLGLSFTFSRIEAGVGAVCYLYFGGNPTDNSAPSKLGFGVKIENGALYGVSYNGSTLLTLDLSKSVSINETVNVTVYGTGAGGVYMYYVNNVYSGSINGGAQGLSGSNHSTIRLWCTNTANSQRYRFSINSVKAFGV